MSGDVVHPSEIDDKDGELLVKLARQAIELYVKTGKKIDIPSDVMPKLMKRGMAFVTIEKLTGTEKELRGCIGFLQPLSPLVRTIIEAAIAAAVEDPRFPPLSPEELDLITVEVSVLSEPVPVKNPLSDVIIGKHGILVMRGFRSGTLLPQVPVEYCWDNETFLAEGCLKAGLAPDCWLDPKTKIFVYESTSYYEESPRGRVLKRDLLAELKTRCKA